MRIAPLKKADEKRILKAAKHGMHFDWYFRSEILSSLYTRYFWYSELNRATNVIAAYDGDHFLGVLLFVKKGKKPFCRSALRSIYVKMCHAILEKVAPYGDAKYDRTNRCLLRKYKREHDPAGEIAFFVADLARHAKGVGTFLLRELQRREPGAEVFLYTDNGCSWQFYEKKGFQRAGMKRIVMTFGRRKVPLTCMLYRRVL